MPEQKKRKTDRRTLYTKRVIKDAFLSLKHTFDYNAISVASLCKEAEISRSTFYLHYHNISEVLDDILDDILSETRDLFTQIGIFNIEKQRCTSPFCIYMRQNPKYHSIFLDDSLTSYIIEKIVSQSKEYTIKELQKKYALTKTQIDTLLYFQFSGCFYVAKKNMRMEQNEWRDVQNCIDDFIKNGFSLCPFRSLS